MSRERRKYIREDIIGRDVKQAKFGVDGLIQVPIPRILIQQNAIPLDKLVTCPFCLVEQRLQLFLVSTKKGISRGKAQCPECKSGMLMRSLLTKWTPDSYAEWVYEYSGSGFWQKIEFEKWSAHLMRLGWTDRFWVRYKELKANQQPNESYIDYVNRQAQEEWNREGANHD